MPVGVAVGSRIGKACIPHEHLPHESLLDLVHERAEFGDISTPPLPDAQTCAVALNPGKERRGPTVTRDTARTVQDPSGIVDSPDAEHLA